MGQYQLVFPLYCLILTISTTGIPSTISKMVAEFNTKKDSSNSKRLLLVSIAILTVISIFGFIAVVAFARILSRIQGNPDCYICYYGIAPAIIFVGVISAFRGYFQGNLKMLPTAVSSLIEQIVKMTMGLFFAYRLAPHGTTFAVLGALLGVSVSELFSFLYLLIHFMFFSRSLNKNSLTDPMSRRVLTKRLLRSSLPITIGGMISPVSSMIDSFLVVNLLMLIGYSDTAATGLLGLQAGVVEPLINLPVVISTSISTVLLPGISGMIAENSHERVKNVISKTFEITLSISMAFSICFIIFGRQILSFLYGNSFSDIELMTATKLLIFGSFNILFLSLVQISSGVLHGLGEANFTVRSLFFGCIAKLISQVVLIIIPSVNIFGATISAGICYFIAFVLNFRKILSCTGVSIAKVYKKVALQEFFVCIIAFFGNYAFQLLFGNTISLFVAGAISVIVFFITFYLFFVYGSDSFKREKFGKRIENS